MISDWRPLVFESAIQDYLSSSRYQGFVKERSPERIWQNLVQEYCWVYLQMNEKLRQIFRPFFLYSELRTLFICLRHVKDRNAGSAADLLDKSLLSDHIKSVLSAAQDTETAVRGIEKIFSSFSGRFSGLVEIFGTSGLRGVEQKTADAYLGAVMEIRRLHPIMKSFFARLIDSRNVLTLYKFLRLEQHKRPLLLAGGTMTEKHMQDITSREDISGICTLVRELVGVRIDTLDPTKVELALYRGLTGFLKKEGREPFGPAPILDYLWRCSLEVMNLNILLSGKDLERDVVSAELVQ